MRSQTCEKDVNDLFYYFLVVVHTRMLLIGCCVNYNI